MRQITKKELDVILANHTKWLLNGEGERADLRGSDLSNTNLSGANLRYADLSGSDLRGSDISCSDLRYTEILGADLRYADITNSNLREASLRGSDLRGSDLSNTNLSGANLRYANLRGAIGQHYITQRSDGYQFFLVLDNDKWMICAGCRYLTIEDYRRHTLTYTKEDKRIETNLILDLAQAKLDAMRDK